jgi:hypothetical protein
MGGKYIKRNTNKCRSVGISVNVIFVVHFSATNLGLVISQIHVREHKLASKWYIARMI